jgi:hypothetical protein
VATVYDVGDYERAFDLALEVAEGLAEELSSTPHELAIAMGRHAAEHDLKTTHRLHFWSAGPSRQPQSHTHPRADKHMGIA